MPVLMIGLSHRTAPLELRERFNLIGDRLDELIDRLRRLNPHAELVALSTCNRTELYVARSELERPDEDDLHELFAAVGQVDIEQLRSFVVCGRKEKAVTHLFEVAAGLDSMVLGEPQILGQVKRAYEVANKSNAVGPVLHRVFQEAISSAKAVRSDSGLDQGRVSVGSVAVDFARQIFSRFDDKTILALGAGDIAKLALRHLHDLSPARLVLVNRTENRGQELLSAMGLAGVGRCEARPFDELDELLVKTDILLTATGSPHPILTVDRFKLLHRRRRSRPLFIIDIAMPRDVEAAVGSLKNIYLYNIDDLQGAVEKTLENRCAILGAARKRIESGVKVCMSQIQNRDVGQLVRLLRQRMHEIGRLEHQRALRKLAAVPLEDMPEAVDAAISEHTTRLINKILHLPLSQLDHRKPDAPLGFAAAALRYLFRLDEPSVLASGFDDDADPPVDASTAAVASEPRTAGAEPPRR